MLRQRARSVCHTTLARQARAGLLLGLDKAVSALDLLRGMVYNLSGGHFPSSLQSSFAIHLEKLQRSPQLPPAAEVPAPADGAAFITEGKVTPKAGSTFIIRVPGWRATRQQRAGGIWANELCRSQWGPQLVPRRFAAKPSPAARLGAGGLGGGGGSGRGAPASADKGTPSQQQLGDKMSPSAAGCSPRSRLAQLAGAQARLLHQGSCRFRRGLF